MIENLRYTARLLARVANDEEMASKALPLAEWGEALARVSRLRKDSEDMLIEATRLQGMV